MGLHILHKHCEFDSKNEEHTCELSGEPCPVNGRKDKCPRPKEEATMESDEPFTEKNHTQH